MTAPLSRVFWSAGSWREQATFSRVRDLLRFHLPSSKYYELAGSYGNGDDAQLPRQAERKAALPLLGTRRTSRAGAPLRRTLRLSKNLCSLLQSAVSKRMILASSLLEI